MISEFHDDRSGDQHEDYERWKAANPNGFVLNVMSSNQGMLHRSHCRHLAGQHQTPANHMSRTSRLKLCSTSRLTLTSEAENRLMKVESCESCKP